MTLVAISEEGHRIRLWLPLWSGLIRWILRLVNRRLRRQGKETQIPVDVILSAVRALKTYRRRHGKLLLLEATDSDGSYVKIVV
ncbi:MAG: hypothetical protein ACI4U2_04405 [Christensenellaceae bacterium]